jgi:hypothetical protein
MPPSRRFALPLVLAGCTNASPDPAQSEQAPVALRKPGPEGCEQEPDSRIRGRFAMGASPHHHLSALYGEARKCTTAFEPGPVVTLMATADGTEPVLTAEGLFYGTCDGERTGPFESATVTTVRFAMTSSFVDYAPFTLDSRQPGRHVSLAVYPIDRCGAQLDAGLGYNARWSLTAGCENVLAPASYEGQPDTLGMGFEKPADAVHIKPVAPGTCDLHVQYFDASGTVTITVL